MKKILVDSNVLLDLLTEDPQWLEWSSKQLQQAAETHQLCINPVIYSEVSIGFETIEEVEDALPSDDFERLPLPVEAAFLAGKCFLKYKKRKGRGKKAFVLPDFFIGAHAAVGQIPLLTRDSSRYRSYLPKLELIAP